MATRQTTDFPAGGVLTDTMLDNEFNEIYTNITDTNIAAGANIAISKTALGTYTTWTPWTPTLTSSGSWTSTVVNFARYTQIGKTVTVAFHITGTTAGGTANLRFTLPIAPANTTTDYVSASVTLFVDNNGTYISGIAGYNSGLATMVVRTYNAGVFDNAANTGFAGQFSYEVS